MEYSFNCHCINDIQVQVQVSIALKNSSEKESANALQVKGHVFLTNDVIRNNY